ncbi:MAG: PQQ-dependent sugar dehydrogenase [Anaerolineales bacterium]|nr:PQQ-dependent sugar dehydrogenase [Anaerolineales bacterium]
MRRVLLVLLLLTLVACLPTPTPPPPTPLPVTVVPDTAAPPTVAPPPTDPATELPPTDTPTGPPPDATSFPNPATYLWQTVVSGLERPVDLQHAGDERLFIIEKAGRIRVLQGGNLVDFPFLNITDRVGSSGNEQGLLGLAFHPRYVENGFFFVNYTDKDGDTVIARFRATADPNIADPSSEVVLLRVDQPFGNHNGGVLAFFGPDGYLYAGLGDGGSAGDPFGNAQKLDSLLGKVLRLDVDSAEPYVIPADNPFGNEIWAYGLRNPWRMSFDSLTGDLYIGDVGQGQWEEIDFISAGSPGGVNFGWKYFEGTHPYDGSPPQGAQLVPPVVEYNHSEGCSVTGGYVYRGSMLEWNGIYLYGDYCSGTVWGLIRSNGGWQAQVLFGGVGRITSFGQDMSGEVYLVLDSGSILRLAPR